MTAYSVHLSQFEGPLDLLLHLVGTEKIRIEDIFVSQVTEQYLEFMRELPELDMENASEFARMAATLIYLKSRSILPRKVEETVEEDELTEEQLIERLREYSAAKQAGEALRVLEEQGIKSYFKLPEEYPVSDAPLDISGVTVDMLSQIFAELQSRIAETDDEPVSIRPDTVTVRQRIKQISQTLKVCGKITFRELIAEASGRIDVVITFIAILEMTTGGHIRLQQQKRFDDITIIPGEAA